MYGTGSIGVFVAHLEVQVGAGRVAGRAHVADPRAARHLLAHVGCDLRQVGVPGRVAEPVLDHHEVAVAAVVPAREDRGAHAGGAHTRAVRDREVDPRVGRPPARGAPKPSPIGPDTGRREAHRADWEWRESVEAAAAAAQRRRPSRGPAIPSAPRPCARWKCEHGQPRTRPEDAVDAARAGSRAAGAGTAAPRRPSRGRRAASCARRGGRARGCRSARRVCGPAMPSTSRPRRRWKRTDRLRRERTPHAVDRDRV